MDNIKEYVVNYKPNRIPIVSGLEQWDFGQYFSSSVGKLNELYKLAKNVANQYKNESKID